MVALISPISDPQLAQRGLAHVLRHWQPGAYRDRDGNTYPHGWWSLVYDADGHPLRHNGKPVRTWKNADKIGPHDAWGNYPGFKPYILPPKSIKRFIAEANGVAHAAEGKADTASLWAAGVGHAFGFFGSAFVPDTLGADLPGWGVHRLNYYCHPDAIKVGQQIINRLNGSGIDVAIFKLPTDEQDNKIDLNDIWRAVNFNQAAFWARLAELPCLDLQPEPIRIYQRPAVTIQGTGDHRPYALKALEDETAKLAATTTHRNDQLYKSAAALAEFIPHGLLTESEIASALTSAALQCGLGERETRTTLRSGIDDGKTEARVFRDRETTSHTYKAAQTTVNPPTWSTSPPAVLDEVYSTFKLALSPLVLLNGVLKAALLSNPTVKQIESTTGLSERQIRNGLDKDAGIDGQKAGILWRCEVSPFSACDKTPNQIEENQEDGPNAKNGETPDTAKNGGRPPEYWVLNDPSVVINNLIERVIIPRLKKYHFPQGDPHRYAPPDKELLISAGVDVSLLDTLTQHLIHPDGNVQALQAFDRDLNDWKTRLRDWTPMTLPDLPEPITNGKLYRAAKVAAVVMPHIGGEIGLRDIAKQARVSLREVSDLLPIACCEMHENVFYVRVEGDLPEAAYNFDHKGWPAYLRTIDANGEIKRQPYTEYDKATGGYSVRIDAIKMAEFTLSQGRPVEIGYRQRGSPEAMTIEKRAQKLADMAQKRAEKCAKRKSKPASTQAHKKGIIAPIFDRPGYAPAYARWWRSALPAHLPPDIARLLIEQPPQPEPPAPVVNVLPKREGPPIVPQEREPLYSPPDTPSPDASQPKHALLTPEQQARWDKIRLTTPKKELPLAWDPKAYQATLDQANRAAARLIASWSRR